MAIDGLGFCWMFRAGPRYLTFFRVCSCNQDFNWKLGILQSLDVLFLASACRTPIRSSSPLFNAFLPSGVKKVKGVRFWSTQDVEATKLTEKIKAWIHLWHLPPHQVGKKFWVNEKNLATLAAILLSDTYFGFFILHLTKARKSLQKLAHLTFNLHSWDPQFHDQASFISFIDWTYPSLPKTPRQF